MIRSHVHIENNHFILKDAAHFFSSVLPELLIHFETLEVTEVALLCKGQGIFLKQDIPLSPEKIGVMSVDSPDAFEKITSVIADRKQVPILTSQTLSPENLKKKSLLSLLSLHYRGLVFTQVGLSENPNRIDKSEVLKQAAPFSEP